VQDVANALWALATLQARPSSELQSFLLIRVQAHFAVLKPCEVATTLWALSQLQAAPPSSWLQELLLRQVGRQQWQGTQPRHWVMCLTACAQLKQVSAVRCCLLCVVLGAVGRGVCADTCVQVMYAPVSEYDPLMCQPRSAYTTCCVIDVTRNTTE
jgi:hypothetical protein